MIENWKKASGRDRETERGISHPGPKLSTLCGVHRVRAAGVMHSGYPFQCIFMQCRRDGPCIYAGPGTMHTTEPRALLRGTTFAIPIGSPYYHSLMPIHCLCLFIAIRCPPVRTHRYSCSFRSTRTGRGSGHGTGRSHHRTRVGSDRGSGRTHRPGRIRPDNTAHHHGEYSATPDHRQAARRAYRARAAALAVPDANSPCAWVTGAGAGPGTSAMGSAGSGVRVAV